jgi:hypothetical protein
LLCANLTGANIEIGTCCEFDPSIGDVRISGQGLTNRSGWVQENCNCLHDNTKVDGSVLPGSYAHYHWTIQDYSLINHAKGGRLTFLLTPCAGAPAMFVKPAILGDGKRMNQLFEADANDPTNHLS